MYEKADLIIGIHVFAKLGEEFYIDSTCFNIVDSSYDCCKPIFMAIGKVLEPRALSEL